MATNYGIMTDYEYNTDHKRERITIWSQPFYSSLDAEGYSLPKLNGYMLTTINGAKIRVECELRNNDNYMEVDKAINDAMNKGWK